MIIYADLCDFAKGLEIVQSVNSIFLPLKKHKRNTSFPLQVSQAGEKAQL